MEYRARVLINLDSMGALHKRTLPTSELNFHRVPDFVAMEYEATFRYGIVPKKFFLGRDGVGQLGQLEWAAPLADCIQIKEVGMRERDHNNLEYEGTPGESFEVTITATGTTIPPTYKIDGGTTQLLGPTGGSIPITLKNASGQRTDLQVITDANAQGSHEFVVNNVLNCVNDIQHLGTCVRTRRVPPRKITLFAFFVA